MTTNRFLHAARQSLWLTQANWPPMPDIEVQAWGLKERPCPERNIYAASVIKNNGNMSTLKRKHNAQADMGVEPKKWRRVPYSNNTGQEAIGREDENPYCEAVTRASAGVNVRTGITTSTRVPGLAFPKCSSPPNSLSRCLIPPIPMPMLPG